MRPWRDSLPVSKALNVSKMLPGVNRVRKARADGTLVELWYAWRGKGAPQILAAEASTPAALKALVEAKAAQAAEAYNAAKRPKADTNFLDGLIGAYLAHMEALDDAVLAPRTKSDRRKQLGRVRKDLGEMERKALEAKGARAMLLAWRNRYAATPKTADDLLGALSTVIQWVVDGGAGMGVVLASNPVAEFPRLYRSNRAEVIWRPEDLALIEPHCAPELWLAVRLAAHTGLRLGDLRALPKGAIGKDAIVWQTGKSRGRRTIIIPVTPDLRQVLADVPQDRDAITVLTSARKRPWTEPGIESALRRAKLDARDLWCKTANDEAAVSPVDHLRWHDLRGTAATNFLLAGLELNDVATILGWKKDKLEQIAARYISAEAIGLAMIKKLARNKKRKPRKPSANSPANDAGGPERVSGQGADLA